MNLFLRSEFSVTGHWDFSFLSKLHSYVFLNLVISIHLYAVNNFLLFVFLMFRNFFYPLVDYYICILVLTNSRGNIIFTFILFIWLLLTQGEQLHWKSSSLEMFPMMRHANCLPQFLDTKLQLSLFSVGSAVVNILLIRSTWHVKSLFPLDFPFLVYLN